MTLIRHAELYIGPLADYQGGGDRAQALKISSSGADDGIRVRFSIKKTVTGAPNEISVTVTNLSESTRSRIRAQLTAIELLAGYEDDANGLRLVARGGVMSAASVRNGPDIETTMFALDGFGGSSRGFYSRSFSAQTSIASIIRGIAASLPGVSIGQIDVDGVTGQKGLALSGKASDQLDRLAAQWGFSWSIQDGVFQALQDSRDSGNVFRLASGANLMQVTPLLSGPAQIQTGIEAVSVMDPRIRPGDRIEIASSVSPTLNGLYKATTVQIDGDTHGQPWTTRIQSLRTA